MYVRAFLNELFIRSSQVKVRSCVRPQLQEASTMALCSCSAFSVPLTMFRAHHVALRFPLQAVKRLKPLRRTEWKRWHTGGALSPLSETEPKTGKTSRALQLRIAQTLFQHVWPSDLDDQERVKTNKRRVLGALGLMVAGKVVTINVPFLFKQLVDALPAAEQMATADPMLATIPLSLVLGYGVSRATASGLQEWRYVSASYCSCLSPLTALIMHRLLHSNAVFAHVAQDAIRRVGRNVFDHVHKLDMQFHLNRNTGQVRRSNVASFSPCIVASSSD